MNTKTTRRACLKAGLGLAAAATAGYFGVRHMGGGNAREKEHILLVVADALRGDIVGKVVNGREVTPNVNMLAREGVMFSNAYSASPFTKISMASIMSGMYPPGHGVESHFFSLPDCPTISRHLSTQGYYCVGLVTNPYMLGELGPGYSTKAMDFGFNPGFAYYRGVDPEGKDAPGGNSDPLSQYADGAMLNEFLKREVLGIRVPAFAEDAPLFLYLHYMDTHQPWIRPVVTTRTGQFHNGQADAAEVQAADRELISRAVLEIEYDKKNLSEADIERLKAIYYEAAARFDDYFGEVLAELSRMGILADTTVIFTSDHGDELMEHGTIGHNQNLFSTALKVPLVIKSKRYTPRVVGARISNAMIFPTVAEMIGGVRLAHTQLESLSPYIEREDLGDMTVFASFYKRDRVILGDGRSAMDYDEPGGEGQKTETLFFNVDKDADEKEPLRQTTAQ